MQRGRRFRRAGHPQRDKRRASAKPLEGNVFMPAGSGSRSELTLAITRFRFAFVSVAVLSAVLNLLLIGGSIYMMLVYDSVLPSHSLPTLFALFGMIVVVYVFQAIFEQMRARILGDVGSSLERQLASRVQDAMSEMSLRGARGAGDGLIPMRDLDAVRGFLSSSGPAALIDLPWIVFFIVVLALLHFWLAIVAFAGAVILLGLTVLTDRLTREPVRQLTQINAYRSGIAESNVRHVEVLTALGMRGRLRHRWEAVNQMYLAANYRVARAVGTLSGMSKAFRMFLQSAILTVGALLVISGKASGGVIFASSMLSGRALAPVDSAIANWRAFSSARAGWARLNELLARMSPEAEAMVLLPLPTRSLEVNGLCVAPPGTQRLTVSGVDIKLKAGDGLGIIGPSAAGKTSLARALIGVWRPARGTIRLDGATLDQWDGERLGAAVGYLPQTVELIEGTVSENIARFEEDAPSEKVITAARAAGVHELIVQLPQGYDTPVGADGQELSAGQRQRIGLARALYGDPFLVLLDEPNSNLDAEGEAALERAISLVRKRGGIPIIIAHRPAALAQVSHVLFMRDGRGEAFGPRDEVLRRITQASRPQNPKVGETSPPQAAANG